MKRLVLFSFLSALILAGCPGKEDGAKPKAQAPTEAAPGQPSSAMQPSAAASSPATKGSATARAGSQPGAQPGAAPAPVETDSSAATLPTVTDFEEEADQTISKANYKQAYQKMKKEVAAQQ